MRTLLFVPAAPAAPILALLVALALPGCTPPPRPMPPAISALQLAQLLGGQMLKKEASAGEEFLLSEEDGEGRVVALRLFVKLGPDRAAVVTRSQGVQGSGPEMERDDAHASGGGFDLTYLKWQGQRWSLERRYAAALQLGSSGEFGRTEGIDLAPGPTGLKAVLVHSGGTWQGLSLDTIDIIPLDGRPPRSVLSEPVASDNQGACEAEQDCWSATSTVKLLPAASAKGLAAIRIEQTLESEPSPLQQPAFLELDADAREALKRRYESDQPPPREQTTTHGTLVFEWSGERYHLRSGRNLVPPI